MEEKVLIKSEQYDAKKVFKVLALIGVALSILLMITFTSEISNSYSYNYETYLEHQEDGDCGYYYYGECYSCREIANNPNKGSYVVSNLFRDYPYFLIPVVFFSLVGGLVYLCLRSYELNVTDKRIVGKVAWGKRVDLPVDSVTATAKIRRGVSVSTASGRISFLMIKNAEEIYETISNLLIKRQQERTSNTAPTVFQQNDEADQLKKYKDLLDGGIITQDEFDAKKKQLLGL